MRAVSSQCALHCAEAIIASRNWSSNTNKGSTHRKSLEHAEFMVAAGYPGAPFGRSRERGNSEALPPNNNVG
jgi:hypothetical protein